VKKMNGEKADQKIRASVGRIPVYLRIRGMTFLIF